MIRQATLADVPRLVELGAIMHQESRFNVLGYAPEKVVELLEGLLADDDFLRVIERDGVIVGMLAGYISEHWCSKALVASDCALFVEPGNRGGVEVVKLIRQFREWAVDRGALMATLGISTGVQTDRTAKLMELVGYECIGHLYEGLA
jgi:hypothetical protein